MALTFTITAFAVTIGFIGLGIWAFRLQGPIKEPRFKALLKAVGYAAFTVSSLGIFFGLMGIAHINIDTTPSADRAMIYGFAVMAATVWLAWYASNVVRDIGEPLRRAERLMGAMSTQIPTTPIGELGLTARELEVVSVIASGSVTDAQIADQLFISKATAATHVRNVLKKANLSNRRDLMLIGGWRDLSDRPTKQQTG